MRRTRLASDERGDRFYTEAEVAGAVDHYTARTIPVHVELHAQETVLSEPEMETLLREARILGLGPCGCREKHGNCDAPLEVCVSLNECAEETIERGRARAVPLEEALEALRLSHEAGLVHLAYRKRDQEVSLVCSCCSCCCFFLTALKRFDYHDALIESAYVASHDPMYCRSCGTCIERCPFDAWAEVSEKQISFEPSRCFGCGLCVSTCPTGAIAFVERDGNEE